MRAIRSFIGANSGTYTQQDRIYYQRKEVTTTNLRVHPGINVITQFLDYSPAASGMTYRNSAKPAGVTIDGVPDPSMETGNALGPEVRWEQATGPQGTLSIVSRYATDIDGLTVGSYYQDDSTSPATAQCGGYADDEAWGSSGPAINMPSVPGGINTDPTLGPAKTFTGSRTIYFSVPGAGAGLAQRRSAQVDSPLQTSVSRQAEPARAELKLRVKGKGIRSSGVSEAGSGSRSRTSARASRPRPRLRQGPEGTRARRPVQARQAHPPGREGPPQAARRARPQGPPQGADPLPGEGRGRPRGRGRGKGRRAALSRRVARRHAQSCGRAISTKSRASSRVASSTPCSIATSRTVVPDAAASLTISVARS